MYSDIIYIGDFITSFIRIIYYLRRDSLYLWYYLHLIFLPVDFVYLQYHQFVQTRTRGVGVLYILNRVVHHTHVSLAVYFPSIHTFNKNLTPWLEISYFSIHRSCLAVSVLYQINNLFNNNLIMIRYRYLILELKKNTIGINNITYIFISILYFILF